MPDLAKTETNLLILYAFILDTHIENPDKVLIDNGDSHVLLSEILAKNPDLLSRKIEERAEVYRQLGWEVPNAE